jgi:hypothetical protein
MFLIYLVIFQGGAVIRQARRDLEANGFDLTTGLLLPDGVTSSSQGSSSFSGIDAKSSHTSTPQLQQPLPQPSQTGLLQHQNQQALQQQQHRQQPEDGLAGEIDCELIAVMDKSRSVVCLQTQYVV